jgi:glutathione synthase/RimK-type ligase-like ATP-grasp enzyme
MILILTTPQDGPARRGEQLLRARGVETLRVDGAFPGEASVCLRWQRSGACTRWLSFRDRRVDLAGVRAVWHRRVRIECSPQIRDRRAMEYAIAESKHLLQSLWMDLAAPWVPAPQPISIDAEEKLRQLSLATSLGFEIPPSLVTNEPQQLLAFWREHHGKVITKLLASPSMRESRLDETYARYTEAMTYRDLAAIQSVEMCPTFAQAYVPKRFELRITIVNDRAFAAAIDSQSSAHSRVDWRKYDLARASYARHALPPEIEAQCVALTRKLGLRYSAIDMILTPDGRYVFLELNPTGEYAWIEAYTGFPITEAICDLLVHLVRSGATTA